MSNTSDAESESESELGVKAESEASSTNVRPSLQDFLMSLPPKERLRLMMGDFRRRITAEPMNAGVHFDASTATANAFALYGMQTISGVMFTPGKPVATDIRLFDIAYSLSRTCRYNGHTLTHYSVAEHSIQVAKAIWRETGDENLRKAALLHDAAEAYTGDIVRAVKQLLKPAITYVENAIALEICEHFGFDSKFLCDPIIAEMDARIIYNERERLLQRTKHEWWKPVTLQTPIIERPINGVVIVPMHADVAYANFMKCFRDWFYPYLEPLSTDSILQQDTKAREWERMVNSFEV